MKQFVGNFFEWLLRASWQAAIIVLLVLAIQWLFRKKLSERWRYALWSLVLFRLLLPTSIPSNLSLYNLTRLAPSSQAIQPKPVATANISPSTSAPDVQHVITPAIQTELPAPPSHAESLAVTPPHKPASFFTSSNLIVAALLIWLAGTLLLLSRILIQNILFARRLRHSKIITDTTTLDLFQDCKSLFGITFPIRLLETSAVHSPALYGFFRPVLLLPSELLSNFTAHELRYIFLHELAHVKRRDMAVHWVATLLGLLHWFNPVLWFAFRRMAADRELACDELALSYANEQESKPYGETIIKLLESYTQTAALPGLMGILEDKDQMTRRISMIARFKKHSRWSLPAIVLLLLLGIFTLTDAQSPILPQVSHPAATVPPSGTNSTSAASSNSQLKFQVLDAISGQPVANAKIRGVRYLRATGTNKVSKLTTDSNGIALIDPPASRHRETDIFVTADGYVPKLIFLKKWDEVPSSYVTRLSPGTAVGGIVVDETQKPVAGAKIEFNGPGLDLAQSENICFGPETTIHTDPSGHWYSSMMPTNLAEIHLVITHSNYARTLQSLSIKASTPTNAIFVMKSSPIVFGSVTDLRGNPIKEATIREVHNYAQPTVSTKSDEDGKFTLKNMGFGELKVVVQANGFAPQLASAIATNTPTQINFHLAPGNFFRGRVVDESGNPITNAVVQTDSDDQGMRKVEWSARTDNEGRFEWNSAPAEPLLYAIDASGYTSIRSKSYKADGSDLVITLQKTGASKVGQSLISGTVLDEETGAPLNDFKVLLGKQRGIPGFPVEFEFATEGNEGSFKYNLPSPIYVQEYQIQIQKDGYLPVVSTNLSVSAGNQTLQFKLHKGSGPSGIVLFPDGSPAGNATVFLCEATGGVYMDKPGEFRKQYSPKTEYVTTGADGRFSFSPKLDARCFIVIHDKGYAETPAATFYTPGKIILQPWGRVEGQLLIGTKPGASQTVSLENVLFRIQPDGRPFAALSLWLKATTDANGRFVIEKAPPGEFRIVRRLPSPSPGPIYETHGIPIKVAAGTTTKVQLGGTGQAVKGRALLADLNKSIDWDRSSASLITKISDPLGSRPKREDYASDKELLAAAKKYADANRAFWSSEQGRALDRARQTFMAPLNPDGSFVIPDVPAGTYELKITINESDKNSIRPNSGFLSSKPLASVTQDVTVPEVPGGFSEEPLDLGTLKLNAANK